MTLLYFSRTQIAQIKGIISLTLVIMSFEHGMHERNGISRLRLWLTSPKSQISNMKDTKKRNISLALVINIPKILNICGLYIPNTKDTKKRNISLALVICGALKERYLKGQSVRAVIWIVIVYWGLKDRHLLYLSVFLDVALTALLLITHLPNNSPHGLPY